MSYDPSNDDDFDEFEFMLQRELAEAMNEKIDAMMEDAIRDAEALHEAIFQAAFSGTTVKVTLSRGTTYYIPPDLRGFFHFLHDEDDK